MLIISGHPDLKNSVANKAILEEISAQLPQAEIRKIDELCTNSQFDVKVEQAAFEKADIIVFQYPMHRYGLPGLFKLYIDKVMEHGWAYGSQGTALADKPFIKLKISPPLASSHRQSKETIRRYYRVHKKFIKLFGWRNVF
ncbi:MAG: NAD(P)H-dependent oxidoreductase [Selenomonadaceae bacterium]|nr:NAD(P)H-dependent oxidoreductase [Selenomonadaceae bacterium]MBR6888522.1 NAD(P)H-dependent oxidoreductase [Selenomonadaceae bacterium]